VSTIAVIGWGAAAMVAVSGLVMSYLAPGPRRTVIEWLWASATVLALSMFLTIRFSRAWESGAHLKLIGWGAAAVLVVGWLVVSFTAPGPRRAVIEWLSASAMYLALSMLFWNLILGAWGSGSHFALVAFGFLGLMFGMGLCVALYNTLRVLRGGVGGAAVSATH